LTRSARHLRCRFVLALGLLSGAAGPAPLAAQSPEFRQQLSAFDLQLASLTDSAAVRAIERDLARQKGDDSLGVLQRALALLRLNQLGNPWAAREAVGKARSATRTHPDWPVAWHLFGRSLLKEGDRKAADPLELGRRVGFGDYEDAADVLAHAVSLEPTYLPALLDLQRAVAETHDTARVTGLFLPALREAAEAGVTAPTFLLYLGRTERSQGSPARAVDAFRSYLREGGERGVGLRELAWASFATGDSSAATAYYEGAREDDSASVAGYRGDLSLIVSDDVLAGFDSLSGEARVAWLRQFWEDRDHEALRAPGERLAEHYRRLTHAERSYSLQANRRLDSFELFGFLDSESAFCGSQFWDCGLDTLMAMVRDSILQNAENPRWETTNYYEQAHAIRAFSDSTRFDERGRVYIRQGEPDTVISSRTFGMHTNETWLYRRPDGDLMLHFGGVPEDVRLRPNLRAIITEGPNAQWFLYNDRCGIYADYCKALVWGPYGLRKLREREDRVVAASTAIATRTDAYDLRFSGGLQFEAAAFAVGHRGALGNVHVTWRYRPGAVPAAEPGTVVRLATRVRAVLLDSTGHAVGWGDTSLAVTVRVGDTTVAQVGRVSLTAPPGTWTYRAALSVGDTIGAIAPRGEVVVPSFESGGVQISDLLLAAPGEGAPWARPEGDTAYVTPRSRWFRSDPLTLYHEIYGLGEGERYSASLLLKRGKRTVLSATYTGIGSFDVTGVYRTLSLKDVSPGEYTLEIAVKGEKGPWARRSRLLTVLKEK
jgi:tetratricopeptide (TPR) repeat protein